MLKNPTENHTLASRSLLGTDKKCREWSLSLKVKELPTYKDTDFRNNMQKVYVSEEEKMMILDKLGRDIEVNTPFS